MQNRNDENCGTKDGKTKSTTVAENKDSREGKENITNH